MNVKVGDALTHAVVQSDEGAVGAEPLFDGPGDALHELKERTNLVFWQIRERLVVSLWHDQAVTDKERAVVEEDNRFRIVGHDVRRDLARGDSTEEATGHYFAPIALSWRSASTRAG